MTRSISQLEARILLNPYYSKEDRDAMKQMFKFAARYQFIRNEWRNLSIGFNGQFVDVVVLETRPEVRCRMTDIEGFDALIDATMHGRNAYPAMQDRECPVDNR